VIGADLHVILTNGDFMFHTIRHADGTWRRFGDVNDVADPTDSGLITIAS
jgi:hypothetical protein